LKKPSLIKRFFLKNETLERKNFNLINGYMKKVREFCKIQKLSSLTERGQRNLMNMETSKRRRSKLVFDEFSLSTEDGFLSERKIKSQIYLSPPHNSD